MILLSVTAIYYAQTLTYQIYLLKLNLTIRESIIRIKIILPLQQHNLIYDEEHVSDEKSRQILTFDR